MPELPEVEVIRLGLAPRLEGRRVISIAASGKELRLPLPLPALDRYVRGAIIEGLERRGKYLVVRMSNRAAMIVHLGMTGRLNSFPADEPIHPHDHLRLCLDNGLELRLRDTRRFGSVQVVLPVDYPDLPPLASLGPEPFTDKFTADYLLPKAAGHRQPVKNLLMDSRVVVGIGNIYASEILFAARLSPATPVNTVSIRQWQTIIRESRRVLSAAIKAGGSTISDYVNGLGQPGQFQKKFKVYGRAGQPCPRCRTSIVKTVMAGRATYSCPKCQPDRA